MSQAPLTLQRLAVIVLAGACGGTTQPAPPASPISTTARTPVAATATSSPSAIDPRVKAIAERSPTLRLPAGRAGAGATTLPAGPIVQILAPGGYVDAASIRTPSDLAHAVGTEGTLVLWLDAALKIRTAAAYLLALPPHTHLHLATENGDQIQTLPADVLGDHRCVAFLAATGATIADVARAAASPVPGDVDGLSRDPRVCGGTVETRLGALRDGRGSLFVRSGLPGGGCHRLDFDEHGLVRPGNIDGHPWLAFAFSITDGSIELRGPLPRTNPAVPVVQCAATYALKGDDPGAVTVAVPQPVMYGRSLTRDAQLFYSEQACLAAPEQSASTIECMRSLLDATSTLHDAVADRVATIDSHPGKLYLLGERCAAFDLHPPSHHESTYGDDVAYNGYALGHVWNTGGHTPSANGPNWTLEPVVQTSGDYVLIGRDRGYLGEATCRKAAH